ncbi:MAG TPA: TonB family protein [Candidatus Koribacter sp.]|jgi:TonB family protein
MAAHCLLLFVILRPAEPKLVKVHQLRLGDGGRSLARLYWSGADREAVAAADQAVHAKKDRDQDVRSKQLLSPSKSLQLRLEKHERLIASVANDRTLVAGKSRDAATAGSHNGSLNSGDLYGDDIRPALWVGGPNPQVVANEFAEGLEGSVIVEITIDDNGNVIATHLLQGLSPAVDGRVIEALQMAHFVPAKRNGVAIASKQDVYYHFPK